MASEYGIYEQFAVHAKSPEDLEALKREARRKERERTKDWVEVSKGVKVPPEQAEEYLRQYPATVELSDQTSEQGSAEVAPSIAPADQSQPKLYVKMLTGTATQQLTKLSTHAVTPLIDNATGIATITDGDFKIFLSKYKELKGGLRISTCKLLDTCQIYLTAQNDYKEKDADKLNYTVLIPIDDIMDLWGIKPSKPSKDKLRRKIDEDLETLYNLSLSWKERRRGGQPKDYEDKRVCIDKGIHKGVVKFSFHPDMAKYLVGAFITQYPLPILKADERNPNIYHIGKKLWRHYNFENNIINGTANILSVRSLLDECKDIPTYEQVLATDRAVDRRIITPFEKALNNQPFKLKWHYCLSKGEPLPEDKKEVADYEYFIGLYIWFEIEDAPDHTERIEEQKKKRLKASSAGKRKAPEEATETDETE